MYITLGRWVPSGSVGKVPRVFYIQSESGDITGIAMARMRMRYFAISDEEITTIEFSSLEKAEEYARKYFELKDFEFSPFPISETDYYSFNSKN